MSELLRIVTSDDPILKSRRFAVDRETLDATRAIVNDVRDRGEPALREYAEKFGDIPLDAPLICKPEALKEALEEIPVETRDLLERTAGRIRKFAQAQRNSFSEISIEIPGGRAGHQIAPVERTGCYAPGGRFPLPSSVLMTAVTARAAGVREVWVASPKPSLVTKAAAAIAGADGLLAAGGAQAIAAFAFGAGKVPACHAVVGPGNRFVTAAKQLVAGQVTIDMLAGPSELVVFADSSADPAVIAADLLAQAEHDPDALPILITTDAKIADSVNEELNLQVDDLPTKETALPALGNGFAAVVSSIEEGLELCDRIAPEHLELHLKEADKVAEKCRHYGGLFIGPKAAEVLGDYGAGPNHTLPTGGTARSIGGLSVMTFLRVRTWLKIDDLEKASQLVSDSEQLACLEGLSGHARSANKRSI